MKLSRTLLFILAVYTFVMSWQISAATCPEALMQVPGGDSIQVSTADGVFAPNTSLGQQFGYRLLEAALKLDLSHMKRILVLGAGTGYDAIVLARNSQAQIDATDVDPAAVAVTKKNVAEAGFSSRVHVIQSDLFRSVNGKYDLILFNAPRPVLYSTFAKNYADPTLAYWPFQTQIESRPDEFDAEGELFHRYIREFPNYLANGGIFLLMSNENLGFGQLPASATDEIVYRAPWGPNHPDDKFAIHKLRLR